ncbi:protease inhibitor I42 family protein [Lysobacter sp. 5GHs7-4]|uniref:protease inhibitor I42 family protein n=1 Tax=Lysobacter sp. 5GHs7-4 TaxID=2904253 RepID=UPI001E60C700|nr:protease inhibitor I42 family protein [Lysobacter sp. 5GHs7-4]UHQ24463.1 protease inhibitor I42 family protein [Lysobacter sp. 5GHs7-4]
MNLRHWFAGCMLASSLAACTSAGAPAASAERVLTAADSAAPVMASVGDVLVVNVEANPSTGYGWIVDTAAAAGTIEQAGEPSMALSHPGAVGGGGTQTWRFRAVAAGQGELRMDYRRAWEKDVPPVRSVSWKIEVR